MARTVNPFKLGLFILLAGALGLSAIIWVGASHLFEKKVAYVTYFDESVKGLQKDAVVNYRGVAVGRVAAIKLAPDGRLIEVQIDLRPEFHVDKSLAVQLREQGLTGMRYMEIDTAPKDIEKLTPKIDFIPPSPLIASAPSEIAQLKLALQSMYDKLNSLDLKGLTDNWSKTAELVNGLLDHLQEAIDPQIWKDTALALNKTANEGATFMERLSHATSASGMNKGFLDLSATLESTRQASETLAKELKELPPGTFGHLAKGWDETITSGGAMFNTVDKRVNESAATLEQSLQQFKILLTQLTGLIQVLKEQPNRMLFPGKPGNPFERK
ncbi:MAG: MlaD family protein [Syntrophobacteraceae bacterium]